MLYSSDGKQQFSDNLYSHCKKTRFIAGGLLPFWLIYTGLITVTGVVHIGVICKPRYGKARFSHGEDQIIDHHHHHHSYEHFHDDDHHKSSPCEVRFNASVTQRWRRPSYSSPSQLFSFLQMFNESQVAGCKENQFRELHSWRGRQNLCLLVNCAHDNIVVQH